MSALALAGVHPPGVGTLHVRRVAGRSVATRAFATSPLRWLQPRNAGHACWTYVTSFGGGLVDGDALSLDIDVGDGATALIGTQASTKVYRARTQGASQRMQLRVGRDATAVVVPDPVVCFAHARYAQRIEIDLAAGASLVLLDTLHAGRVSRGERWAFARYASRIDVRIDGRLALTDRVLLDPSHGSLVARLDRFDALGTLLVIGARAAPLAARIGRTRSAPLEAVSTLRDDTVLVRFAAVSAADALAATRAYLDFVPLLLGDDPFARRW